MVTSPRSRRPICPTCSKPISLCLCIRLKSSNLDNSVAVTILQHSLEKKHPLNSTRIATLGLKNVSVTVVSDVQIDARFVIRLIESEPATKLVESGEYDHPDLGNEGFTSSGECSLRSELNDLQNSVSDHLMYKYGSENGKAKDFVEGDCHLRSEVHGKRKFSDDLYVCHIDGSIEELKCPFSEKSNSGISTCALEQSSLDMFDGENENSECRFLKPHSGPNGIMRGDEEEPVITVAIVKSGVITSFASCWMPQTNDACNALAKGFIVKRFQKRELQGSTETEEYEEFEIVVPPGSVLLFPTTNAIGVEDIDFEAKNLIVLDGTWAKAKRVYNENPWLKLLPHLKLDLEGTSLYREVRHQPKPGCLSTIESIVYALKTIGDNPEGLDSLLDVFESMVGDQRRCKDERLSKRSAS
ncbi:DTW protein [Dillenia turbinata]|uniref:tRNA-uridine aminocarboxypropyltransferase n=1 Tax=Dillenia turbinata TaxID=194707 RepID=A0AAN8W7Y4_9MAGN